MLLYAVPGFALVKTKLVKESAIPGFAIVLMYVCQPCLTLYTFLKVDFSWRLAMNLLIFLALTFFLMAFILVTFFFATKKKHEDGRYKVCSLAACFGNIGFMGIPLLEAVFPDNPEVTLYSNMFFLSMNTLGWTIGSYILTGDKSYVSVKKTLLNPAIISFAVAIPLFMTGVKLPEQLTAAFTLLGKMTTPMCMLVLGMRLATVPVKPLFCSPLQYVTVGIKQILMPLIAYVLVMFLPLDPILKRTFFVLCCCPVASVVLNFAEMLGKGQQCSANVVLLGTLLSVITIPVLLLIP